MASVSSVERSILFVWFSIRAQYTGARRDCQTRKSVLDPAWRQVYKYHYGKQKRFLAKAGVAGGALAAAALGVETPAETAPGSCKVLLINGSPHEKGCTYTALSVVAEELEKNGVKAEIIHVGNGPTFDCTACGFCHRSGSGKCVFKEDACNDIIEKAKDAQGFVFGSPVYYGHPSGRLLGVMDRLSVAGGRHSRASRRRRWPPRGVRGPRHAGCHPEALLHQPDAHGGLLLLERGARQRAGRGAQGRGGPGHHAPARCQHGACRQGLCCPAARPTAPRATTNFIR